MTGTATMEITEPGVYDDLPNDTYHADPVPAGSLSVSGARKLLPPHCPAIFAYERTHGRTTTTAFEFGHAAHDKVLGAGPEIVCCDFPDWRTKKAQEVAKEIRGRGGVPLLPDDYRKVQEMADAILAHPIASVLFAPDSGTPEASLFWVDEPSGVWRRARLDWKPTAQPGKRLIIPDYKTADSANPDRFAKSAVNFGYHQQDAWYTEAAETLNLGDDPAFVFVVQEKTPPYLVSVIQLDRNARRIGDLLNRQAINTYAECTSTGHWPTYTDDVVLTSLPYWYERNFEEL